MAIVIRHTTPADLPALGRIEAVCFPAAEAASAETLRERFDVFPEYFFTAEDGERPVGFINGMITDRAAISDEMFSTPSSHNPDGARLAVLGLNVLPAYRRQGIARRLMETLLGQARANGKSGAVLTCKEHLIRYYETFGYRCLGVSASVHGGAVWYDMLLPLREPTAD